MVELEIYATLKSPFDEPQMYNFQSDSLEVPPIISWYRMIRSIYILQYELIETFFILFSNSSCLYACIL